MALRRILQNSQKLSNCQNLRYYHYSSCGRSLMGNPDEQPTPKTYFNYHYVFDNYPDALNGFKYAPRDPFVVQHVFAYETFEFRYEGHWWNIGSIFCNALWFTFPAILWLILWSDNDSIARRRGNRNSSYHNYGGFFHFQIYDAWEDPIIKE